LDWAEPEGATQSVPTRPGPPDPRGAHRPEDGGATADAATWACAPGAPRAHAPIKGKPRAPARPCLAPHSPPAQRPRLRRLGPSRRVRRRPDSVAAVPPISGRCRRLPPRVSSCTSPPPSPLPDPRLTRTPQCPNLRRLERRRSVLLCA
jgi:hypothetical protein